METIILIPDSFKGTLSSRQVCEAMERAVLRRKPRARVISIPVADGGEGTVEAFLTAMGGERVECTVCGPHFAPMTAFYGLLPDGTAVIEMAACAGLPLAGKKKNPERTTTYGVGQLIMDALDKGARKFLIGLGGSATNDCGMGMLEALGYKFYDTEGLELSASGEAMCRVARVDDTNLDARLAKCEIVVASDVDNVLSGKRGAAWVYAKQKGATPTMIDALDRGMCSFAEVVGGDYHNLPGAGAAGGVGYALMALLGATLKPGIELVLDTLNFEEWHNRVGHSFWDEEVLPD